MTTLPLEGVTSSPNADSVSEAGALAPSSSATQVEASKIAVEFEAVFLATFVEAMLPKSDSIYGGGMAGDMWKSQLASGIAMQLAQNSLLGLGERVVRDAQYRSRNRI